MAEGRSEGAGQVTSGLHELHQNRHGLSGDGKGGHLLAGKGGGHLHAGRGGGG